MHYKNGREAKAGDQVIHLPKFGTPQVGLLHSLQPQSQACNGRLAVVTTNDPYVTLSDCLHVEDVAAAFTPPPSPPVVVEMAEAKAQ